MTYSRHPPDAALNHFSDLNKRQFENTALGLVAAPKATAPSAPPLKRIGDSGRRRLLQNLPLSWDWSSMGKTGSIRNQVCVMLSKTGLRLSMMQICLCQQQIYEWMRWCNGATRITALWHSCRPTFIVFSPSGCLHTGQLRLMLGACRRIRNRGQAAHSGWPALKRDLRVPVNPASRELPRGGLHTGSAPQWRLRMASLT